MKELLEKMEKAAQAQRELEAAGAMSVNYNAACKLTGAMLKNSAFEKFSEGQKVKYRCRIGCEVYPHELSFEIEDYKLYAIYSDDELLKRYGVEARQTDEIKEAV